MIDPVLLVEILAACKNANVIPTKSDGFAEVSPSVIMFSGVKTDIVYAKTGKGRHRRYMAVVYPNKVVIEPYGN